MGLARLDIEESRVEPDILVVSGDEETPSRRQRKVRDGVRCPFVEMVGVEGCKEIRIGGELLTAPYVPARSICLRRMPQPIERFGASLHLGCNPPPLNQSLEVWAQLLIFHLLRVVRLWHALP